MSCLIYEKHSLPHRFKADDLFKDVSYGMCMQAFILGPSGFGTILHARFMDDEGKFNIVAEGIKYHCNGGDENELIPISVMKWVDFRKAVLDAIAVPCSVAVTVVLVRDGKCETFSSFLTASSQQAHAGFVKGYDLTALIKKTNVSISSKYANCAYCMSQHAYGKCADYPKCQEVCEEAHALWSRDLKKCSGCKSVFYCSEECQRLDWARGHKVACEVFHWLSPRFYPQLESDQEFINEIAKTATRFLPPFQIPDSFEFPGMKDYDA